MKIATIQALCAAFPGADYYYPFGEQPQCYRVGGRMFAELYPVGVPGALTIILEDESIPREKIMPMVLLHCEPSFGDFFKHLYPKTVLRPYHSPAVQRPYRCTVLIDGTLPDEVWQEMIDHSYHYVVQKLPKRVQKELLESGRGRKA